MSEPTFADLSGQNLDRRIGHDTDKGRQWPALDVLGRPYRRAGATTQDLGDGRGFVVIPTAKPADLITAAVAEATAHYQKTTGAQSGAEAVAQSPQPVPDTTPAPPKRGKQKECSECPE